MALWKLVALGFVTELLYLSLYVTTPPGEGVAMFLAVNALAFLPFGLLVRNVLTAKVETQSGKTRIGWIVFFGLLFRLTLVPLAPVASDDVYRYVWDGKVALSGTNPFALPPNDPRFSRLHTEDLPSKINFPAMRTIYPPLAQGFFSLSSMLFGDSIPGMKFLLVLCELGTLFVLLLLLRHLGLDPARVVLYAWCPLPIMYFGLDGHIDALGIPLLLLSIYGIIVNRRISGAVTLGLAGLAKLYPMLVVPLLLRAGKNMRENAVALLPLLVFAVGCWAYFEPTGGLAESFTVYCSRFEFNGSVFSLLNVSLNDNAIARGVCGVVFVAGVLILVFTDRSLIEKTFLVFLGFVICSPVVHPWYLAWLSALIVVRWSPAAFSLLGLSNLSNVVVYQYKETGAWRDNPLLMLVEYLPFFAILAWELWRGRIRSGRLVSRELQK
jgi:alpha-1,6-mannosyltransferase